jgi:predicted secreted protein
VLWNPSSEKLLNIEEDEAGRLAAFRSRFGRGWDSSGATTAAAAATPADKEAAEKEAAEADEEEDNLLDLISSFGQASPDTQASGGKKIGK